LTLGRPSSTGQIPDTEKENHVSEQYKGFTFEASVVKVAPREFRATALIYKGNSIVWREPSSTSFLTVAEACAEAEIIAPNVIDRLIESGELNE
jgi:hypothetical protein